MGSKCISIRNCCLEGRIRKSNAPYHSESLQLQKTNMLNTVMKIACVFFVMMVMVHRIAANSSNGGTGNGNNNQHCISQNGGPNACAPPQQPRDMQFIIEW